MAAKLVSIIGPPAVGKTTLAELLVEELLAERAAAGPVELRREDYEGNPFLAEAYTGCVEARLPAQLWYLLSRVRQLSQWDWPAGGVVVTDYGFCQDPIYARAQLTAGELDVYQPVLDRVRELVQPPAVTICLDAPVEMLLERIASRGREFERSMTAGFLQSMRDAYNDIGPDQKLIRVDCGNRDFRDADVRAGLLEAIGRAI